MQITKPGGLDPMTDEQFDKITRKIDAAFYILIMMIAGCSAIIILALETK